MSINWRDLCRKPRVEIDGDDVIVRFESERKHRVRVTETPDAFEIHAIVARSAAVRDIKDLPRRLWTHNRAGQLVSFRIDPRERVCARGWVPKAGITPEDFEIVLHRVASESDRLEFLLTGKDTE